MTLYLNGTTGVSGVDGSAGTPAIQGTDTNTGISFPAADTIAFNEGGAEVGRFDSSGRLLVGTSSSPTQPQGQYALLVVQGYQGSSTGEGIAAIQRGLGAASLSNGSDIGRLIFNDSAGNTFAGIYCNADATPGAGDYPGRLVFSTCGDGASSPTERMRIRNSGEVLIGQTATLGTGISLQVANNAGDWVSYFSNAQSSTPFGLQVHYTGAAPNGTGNEFLFFRDTAATRAAIRSNGGLANFQANNVNLSDRNTKKDISPAAGTWDCIKEWEIVNYRYKDQADDADLNLGVIAQQVAESCPEVITVFQEAKEATEDQPAQEERLGVKEQQMYWMAIKALQEAQVRIETLEAKVAALESA